MNAFPTNPQNHPLIPREQTFLLDRKIVSIHSEDRDISKWPNCNNFEVTLPEDLINIQSMRLINTIFPSNQYVITNNYQNTTMQFYVIPDISGSSPEHTILNDLSGTPYKTTISEGFYEPDQIALELTNAMNATVLDAMIQHEPTFTGTYDHFNIVYNKIKHKLFIGNDRDNFTLDFSNQIPYPDISCGYSPVWNNYEKWGLPYYLGYKKETYSPIGISGNDLTVTSSYAFKYDGIEWLTLDPSSASLQVYVSESPCLLNMFGENAMYIELDRYNSIDEIDPYSENTMASFNNDYGGRVNSAFAKIPLVQFPYSQIYDSRNAFLTNIKVFNPPLPKLRKMKFTLRYHDGRLVDFGCMPFSFSVEINQLRDEQHRCLRVRVPDAYLL